MYYVLAFNSAGFPTVLGSGPTPHAAGESMPDDLAKACKYVDYLAACELAFVNHHAGSADDGKQVVHVQGSTEIPIYVQYQMD